MRLPEYLTKLSPVGETLDAMDAGVEKLTGETARRNRQLSVSTAEEGLDLWERDYSRPEAPLAPAELRRARIRGILEGEQTLTVQRLEALAINVGNADYGRAEEDFPAYQVTLLAVCQNRMPGDLTALRETVERQCPAHLQVDVMGVAGVQGAVPRYTAAHGGMLVTLRGSAAQLEET